MAVGEVVPVDILFDKPRWNMYLTSDTDRLAALKRPLPYVEGSLHRRARPNPDAPLNPANMQKAPLRQFPSATSLAR